MPRKLTASYNLQVKSPRLSNEWHPTKNGSLTPKDVTPGSGRRVWWICDHGHEWRTAVTYRNKGSGCPYCDGKLPTPETCLEFVNPEIAKQWHPTKNGSLTPKDVTPGSKKRVWWICEKGHEWKIDVGSRSRGRECPYCTGRYLTYERSLEFKFPEISKELHPTKNVNLSASNLYSSANKKVWWKCKKGHEYQATVASRTSMGSGCPICRSGYSLIELRLYCELKTIFEQVKIRENMYGKECDVYLPNLKVAVEIDGYPWHAKKEKKDKKKTEQLAKHGIKTYRIRDQRLKPLSEKDIMFENYETKSQKTIIRQLINQLITNEPLTPLEIKKAEEYLFGNKFKNQKEFKKIQSTLPGPLPGKSLADHPKLIKDWHYEKNYPLIPNLFSTQSHQKVWWKCEKGHEYKDKIQNRVNKPGSGCGPCNLKKSALKRSMQIAKNGKSIADVCPNIIKEWHPKKNGERTPFNVPVSSHLVAWWICSKGHEYDMTVSRRTGDRNKGCPYCSNMRVGKDNNLAFLYKNLAKEWHPTKNGKLKPSDVVPGTPRKVWWLCPKKHEYETQVRSRAIRKTGCPHCRNKR
jgi:very-short-patch-repair endonuclease